MKEEEDIPNPHHSQVLLLSHHPGILGIPVIPGKENQSVVPAGTTTARFPIRILDPRPWDTTFVLFQFHKLLFLFMTVRTSEAFFSLEFQMDISLTLEPGQVWNT